MLSHWTKVSFGRGKRPVYLENAKYVQGQTFICGYQVDKHGNPVYSKSGGEVLHLIQLGPNVRVTEMEMEKIYGYLVPRHVGNYFDVKITETP